jgi:uncharacterized SAM-binding protein YcdF (DUF218 family)
MHHSRRWLIYSLLMLTGIICFISLAPSYLGPNDLKSCDARPDMAHNDTDCHPSDAIIALSGGDTAARTDEAIKLYQQGWAPRLIFSGAAQDKTGVSNAEAMKRRAERAGIPSDAVTIDETSSNTQENAENTRQYILLYQLKRIIVVTSAYHQRRASLEFQKQVGAEIQIINHPVVYDKQWRPYWYFTFYGWWLLFGELIKICGFYVGIS